MKRLQATNSVMNFCKQVSGFLCSIALLTMNCHGEELGLFLSNGTCVLEFKEKTNFTTVFCQENGTLVGLDVDEEAGLIFWSVNYRPNSLKAEIFSASLNGTNVTTIFNDTQLVNGLVVDRIARYLYWTDEELKYLQSSKYDGTDMRIVIFQDLHMPRGLVVDHIQGWLFWNDQEKQTVEMSMLDGSERKVLASNISQPNQMAIVTLNTTTRKLYFVDASDQSLKSILLLSSNTSSEPIIRSVAVELTLHDVLPQNETLFGLAVRGGTVYMSTWGECKLLKVDLINKTSQVISVHLGKSRLYSLAISKGDVPNNPIQNSTEDGNSTGNTDAPTNFSPNSTSADNSTGNKSTVSSILDNSTTLLTTTTATPHVYRTTVTTDSTANNFTTDSTLHNTTTDKNSTNHDSTTDNFTTDNSTSHNSTADNNSTNYNSTDEKNSTNYNSTADKNSTNHNITTDNNSANQNVTTDNSTSHNVTTDNSTNNNVTTDNNSTNHNVTSDNSTNHNVTNDNNSTNHNVTTDNNSTNHNVTTNNSTFDNASHKNTSSPSPCDWSKNSCSHVCIPLGPKLGYKCACPTYGGLSLDHEGNGCRAPPNALVYADELHKHIGWMDTSKRPSNNPFDLHLVARSPRPIAVAYDPLEKLVYWSDSKDGWIHKRPFDASKPADVFLGQSDNIDNIDGLAIDYIRRNLYFSNMDESTINATLYSKHTVEVVGLNSKNARMVITRNADRPRGLWIDVYAKHLYYTDRGQMAKVVRSNLDGTDAITILSNQTDKFQNPNSVVTSSNKVFVAASVSANESAASSLQGYLWYIDKDIFGGNSMTYNWSKSVLQNSEVPFGMAASSISPLIFISSWYGGCLSEYNITAGQSFCFANLSGIRGLAFVDTNISVVNDSTCDLSSDCGTKGGMCLSSGVGKSKCYCPSYRGMIMSSDKNACEVPKNFFLIADMMAIRLLGYDTIDQSLYDIVSGNWSNSYSALAYEPTSGTIFYSDVNQRMIRKTSLEKSSNELFYNGPLADDMLIYNNSLYWIDSQQDNASIARITLGNGGSASHKVLLSNLAVHKPKSLAIHKLKGHLYFTSDELPYVWRYDLKVGGKEVQFNASGPLFESGPLFIDEEREVLYLMDRKIGSVTSCSLANLNQTMAFKSVANLTGGLHFYSFAVHNDSIYYSNWADKSLYVFDLLNQTKRTIARNLIRPTRFILQRSTSNVVPRLFPPYFIDCPQDIHIFTTNAQESAWWKEPTLGGISDKRVEESITVNIKPGSSLALGVHVVKYSASDVQGLGTECSFNVSIVKIGGSLSCNKTYSVINGDLSCNLSSSPPVCKVECNQNYIPLFQALGVKFEFCGAGRNQTNVFFCAESFKKVPTVQLKLEFSGSCPKDQNLFALKLAYSFYLLGLCSPSDASYQSGADLCNNRNFRSITCSGLNRRKRDTQPAESRFSVEMLLWEIESLNSKVAELNASLNKLNVQYNNETMKGVKMTTNVTISGCPATSFEVNNDTCVICPYGTKFSSTSHSCEMCPENTYQPDDGQSTCDQCPVNRVSPPGSYDSRQCLTKEDVQPSPSQEENRNQLIIGIIVSLILGIIVVILLVLLACWHAKKKEERLFESETRRRMEANRGYFGDYPEPDDDPIPLSTYSTSAKQTGHGNSGFEMTASA